MYIGRIPILMFNIIRLYCEWHLCNELKTTLRVVCFQKPVWMDLKFSSNKDKNQNLNIAILQKNNCTFEKHFRTWSQNFNTNQDPMDSTHTRISRITGMCTLNGINAVLIKTIFSSRKRTFFTFTNVFVLWIFMRNTVIFICLNMLSTIHICVLCTCTLDVVFRIFFSILPIVLISNT